MEKFYFAHEVKDIIYWQQQLFYRGERIGIEIYMDGNVACAHFGGKTIMGKGYGPKERFKGLYNKLAPYEAYSYENPPKIEQ